MSSLNLKQRIFIVKEYYRVGESASVVILNFKRHFRVKSSPALITIKRVIEKFEEEGTVQGSPRKHPRPVKSEENIESVKDVITTTPSKSVRKISSEAGLKRSSVHVILTSDLKMYPYKVQVVHGLKDGDPERRLLYCQWFLNKARETPEFLDSVFFSDEATFHLSGQVNRQNTRFWGLENPHEIAETKSFSPKVTVWAATSSARVIGPFFFEYDQGKAVTVNKKNYVNALETYFIPRLRELRIPLHSVWFQNDNATPHTSGLSTQYLERRFQDRVIGKDLWPARSPDLSPLDFFLFGYLKKRVYRNTPASTEDLKTAIVEEVATVNQGMLQNVFRNILTRVKKCTSRGGQHFQHLL